MATFTMDGSRIRSRDQFWQEYLAIVRPEGAEHFGCNLDAFNDSLWGGPGWPGNDFNLRLLCSKQVSDAVGADFYECIGRRSARLEAREAGIAVEAPQRNLISLITR